MKLSRIKKLLQTEPVNEITGDPDFKTACGSDLMSDVLAFCRHKTLLLTGLTNPQVVRTAEMTGIKVIILVRGKVPPSATVSLAAEKRIALYVSQKSLFACCGLLYQNGIKPEKIRSVD